ncbi:hypothetical protein RUND412_008129 [Rhizina undulata]
MSASPTLLACSRHHSQTLGIHKSFKPILQTMNSLSRRTNRASSKRPLNDENADAYASKGSITFSPESPTKRVKSTNAPSGLSRKALGRKEKNTSQSMPQKKLELAPQRTSSKARVIIPLVPVSPRLRKRARPPEVQSITITNSFAIHEDSAEDTINLALEHAVNTLDISVAEKDEIEVRGKENISPERLEELLALEPSVRREAMRLDEVVKASRRKQTGERTVLGEIDVKALGYDADECVWVYDDDECDVVNAEGGEKSLTLLEIKVEACE